MRNFVREDRFELVGGEVEDGGGGQQDDGTKPSGDTGATVHRGDEDSYGAAHSHASSECFRDRERQRIRLCAGAAER